MQNTYKLHVTHHCMTRIMDSKLALLLIVGLLYAVHQTFAGESQFLIFRASAILNVASDSEEIDIRPSNPLTWSKESEVTSVLPRPHLHFNEGGLYFREVVEACIHFVIRCNPVNVT